MRLELTIDVDDLSSAITFYCGGLGFTLIEQSETWARAQLDGLSIWLCEFRAGPADRIIRSFDRHWTPVHLDLIVDDVDAMVERAIEFGGILEGEIRRDQPEPIGCLSDIANLSDPSGNGIDLIQRQDGAHDA